jgi:tRNA G10  N-methylase Trm11
MIKMPPPKPPSYVFIPGKNWKLSLAELTAFFRTRRHVFKIADVSKSFFLINSEERFSPLLIEGLGGTIKIGLVLADIPSETMERAFLDKDEQEQAKIRARLTEECPVNEVFKVPSDKYVFGASVYFEDSRFSRPSKEIQRFIGSYFKKKLAAQDKKARFMGFPRDRKLPQLTHIEVLKRELIEKSAEILVIISGQQTHIARTIAVHNPFEFQKRDVHRPTQRKIFSIPPRLARIMVNLSSCLPGKVLLDPFCGVGTILQEALLTKAQVIGMDISPWCVQASYDNLQWLKKEYRLDNTDFKIVLGDSRRLTKQIGKEAVDCIVTEPDLGPALRHLPTEHYATTIVDKLKPLYYDFLVEAYKALKNGGYLVLVTPCIKTRRELFVHLDIEDKAVSIGLRIASPFEKKDFATETTLTEQATRASSFIDIEKRHRIGREIHVLQK